MDNTVGRLVPIFSNQKPSDDIYLVLQLAKLSGFSPIMTSASVKNSDALKELGATHVLDRNLSTESLKAEIAKITSKPLELVFDAVSVGTQQIAVDLVAPGGNVLVIMNPTVTPTEGKRIAKATGKLRIDYNIELLERLYHDEIYGLLEKGLITVSSFSSFLIFVFFSSS